MECESERIRPVEVRSWRLVAQRKTKADARLPNTSPRVLSSASGEAQPVMILPPEGNIAAIDFGTTYCSLAYTTDGDKNSYCLKLDSGGYHNRVPTAILLKKNDTANNPSSIPCEIRGFGKEVHKRVRGRDTDKYLCFERVKMNLQHDPHVHREMTVQDQNGTQWYLIEIIAFIMRYLKDKLEDRLSRTHNPLRAVDFNWVITVPAIWQARGRGMMREAAYMAGLCSDVPAINCLTKFQDGQKVQRPNETNRERLTLAPEPEAAALYCQHMSPAAYCDQVSTFESRKCVVLDIGGGTVDITALKSNASGDIEVLQAPTGNGWGGTSVNREFVKLLQKIVGEEGDPVHLETAFPSYFQDSTDSFAAKKAALTEAIYEDFERQKESFGDHADRVVPETESDDEIICFKMPDTFYHHYKLGTIDQQHIPEVRNKWIEIEDDSIYIPYHKAQELFKPAITKILECTEGVLSKLSSQVDTIYLVGGFGGCKYVYEHISHMIKTKFSHCNYRLIVPEDRRLAVAMGAILFNQPTTVFKSRVVDASYGLAVSVPFLRDTHSQDYLKYDEDGDEICTDAFLTFIDEGETAQSSEVAVDDIVPLVDNVHKVSIPIYRSHVVPTEYITERTGRQVTPIAHKVGELLMEIPKHHITHKSQRIFRVMFDFSGTEIRVFARYISNEEQVVGVALDFLNKSL